MKNKSKKARNAIKKDANKVRRVTANGLKKYGTEVGSAMSTVGGAMCMTGVGCAIGGPLAAAGVGVGAASRATQVGSNAINRHDACLLDVDNSINSCKIDCCNYNTLSDIQNNISNIVDNMDNNSPDYEEQSKDLLELDNNINSINDIHQYFESYDELPNDIKLSDEEKEDSNNRYNELLDDVCKTSKHYNINNETSCIQDCDNSRHSKEESCKYSKDWKKIATNSSKALLKTGLNAASTVSGVGKAAGAGAKAIKAAEALEAGGKLTKVYKAVKTANDLGLID